MGSASVHNSAGCWYHSLSVVGEWPPLTNEARAPPAASAPSAMPPWRAARRVRARVAAESAGVGPAGVALAMVDSEEVQARRWRAYRFIEPPETAAMAPVSCSHRT